MMSFDACVATASRRRRARTGEHDQAVVRRRMTSHLLLPATFVACLAIMAFAPAANAASGGFTIDGVVPDAGATFFADPSGATSELGAVNASYNKVGNI